MSAATNPNLSILPDLLAVCILPSDSALPEWAFPGNFIALTRTTDELSVVCPQRYVPAEVKAEPNWRAFQVAGPLDFSLVGILASIASPLAAVGISIFVISTYQTDYILVKESSLTQAVDALIQAGFMVENNVSIPS